ncbi:MAG TPA: TMEM175 family protein [Segetibacter sp.]|jgi:uncharacterized membrane protein
MSKGRLEAFSDGVLAIIITIMVLEMKVPHGDSIEVLRPIIPVFISYILSFINIGIYWNNHHHMMQAVHHISGKVMWANMHLLFWLSLVPFTTGWMGENNFTTWTVALYGFVLLMAGVAYFILAHSLVSIHGNESTLAKAIGRDRKGIISVVLYGLAVGLAFVHTLISMILFTVVAIMWFIPDKRIENKLLHVDDVKPH